MALRTFASRRGRAGIVRGSGCAVVLAIAGLPAQSWAQAASDGSVAPIEISVKGVSAERTISEFMELCVRPTFNVGAMKAAVARSDLAYVEEEPDPEEKQSFRWRSTRAYLGLELGGRYMLGQCTLSMGTIEPRSGNQLAAMMRPAIEAELGVTVAVLATPASVELRWSDRAGGHRYRLTLVGSPTEPHQSQWYALDKLAAGGNEASDAKPN